MSTPGGDQPTRRPAGEPTWVRRRRLAAVFGETSTDAHPPEGDDPPAVEAERETERWLRGQVPPHHS